jgi:ribonuclease J
MDPNRVQVYTLGGWGEYGRNSTLITFGKNAIILDCGINVSALVSGNRSNKAMFPEYHKKILQDLNILGVLLSHAHLDHIGAIDYFSKKFETLYFGSAFTLEVCKTMGYFNEGTVVVPGETYNLGPFQFNGVYVQHSIPQSLFYKIIVNGITICYASDFKNDLRPVLGDKTDFQKLKDELGHLDYFIFDTTRAYAIERVKSEKYIRDLLRETLSTANVHYRHIFYACYASHISRIKTVVDVATHYGYKIFIVGRSFPIYLNAALFTDVYKLPPNVKVMAKNYVKLFNSELHAEKTLFITSGVNGELNSVLYRLARKELKFLNMEKDLVLIGGHEIPASQYQRRNMVNNLLMDNVNVSEIHESGHAGITDLLDLIKIIKPGCLLPTHSDISIAGKIVDHLRKEGAYKLNKSIHLLGENSYLTLK